MSAVFWFDNFICQKRAMLFAPATRYGMSDGRRVAVVAFGFSAVVVALIVGRNPAWTKVPVDLGRALTTVRQY